MAELQAAASTQMRLRLCRVGGLPLLLVTGSGIAAAAAVARAARAVATMTATWTGMLARACVGLQMQSAIGIGTETETERAAAELEVQRQLRQAVVVALAAADMMTMTMTVMRVVDVAATVATATVANQLIQISDTLPRGRIMLVPARLCGQVQAEERARPVAAVPAAASLLVEAVAVAAYFVAPGRQPRGQDKVQEASVAAAQALAVLVAAHQKAAARALRLVAAPAPFAATAWAMRRAETVTRATVSRWLVEQGEALSLCRLSPSAMTTLVWMRRRRACAGATPRLLRHCPFPHLAAPASAGQPRRGYSLRQAPHRPPLQLQLLVDRGSALLLGHNRSRSCHLPQYSLRRLMPIQASLLQA